jgi:hypothetical protein
MFTDHLGGRSLDEESVKTFELLKTFFCGCNKPYQIFHSGVSLQMYSSWITNGLQNVAGEHLSPYKLGGQMVVSYRVGDNSLLEPLA